MHIQTIHSEQELQTILPEWQALHLEYGRSPFTDPTFFAVWWDTFGRSDTLELHITTGHSGGRLVALAPLVLVRRYGIRFLEWGAANIFDYQSTLFNNRAEKRLFWDAVRESQGYTVSR
jgi:CelD/BcsL family acetyltransferase involved in cellulose biosynthesis